LWPLTSPELLRLWLTSTRNSPLLRILARSRLALLDSTSSGPAIRATAGQDSSNRQQVSSTRNIESPRQNRPTGQCSGSSKPDMSGQLSAQTKGAEVRTARPSMPASNHTQHHVQVLSDCIFWLLIC